MIKWKYSGLHIGRLRISFYGIAISEEYGCLCIYNPFCFKKWETEDYPTKHKHIHIRLSWWNLVWEYKR